MENAIERTVHPSMTATEMIAYLETLPLEYALWWFIENTSEATIVRSDVFFFLRERIRTEAPIASGVKRTRSAKAKQAGVSRLVDVRAGDTCES